MKLALVVTIFAIASALFGCDSGTDKSVNSNPNTVQAKKTASVEVVEVSTPVSTLSTSFPKSYASLPREKGGACALDPTKFEGDKKFISGWSAISANEGVLAEVVVIGFHRGNQEMFNVTSKQKREDVAKYFGNPLLADAGFQFYVDANQINGVDSVTVYQIFQGKVYYCSVKLN